MENDKNFSSVQQAPTAPQILPDILYALHVANTASCLPSESESISNNVPHLELTSELKGEICEKFDLSSEEFDALESDIPNSYSPAEVQISVETILVEDLPITTPIDSLECHIKLGKKEWCTDKLPATSEIEWRLDKNFCLGDDMNQLELSFWNVYPKDNSDHFGKNWLKSLDSFGQRLKSSLRSSKISLTLEDESDCSEPKESISNFSSIPRKLSKELKKENDKRSHLGETNWPMSAFSSFRQPKHAKKAFNRCKSFDNKTEAVNESFREKFASTDAKTPTKNIEVKDEINVQRQNHQKIRKQESLQKSHKSAEFLFSPFRHRSFKISPKKDLQLWKRLNSSFQEKIMETLESHSDSEESKTNSSKNHSPNRRLSLQQEDPIIEYAKDRIGVIKLSLQDCFIRANYTNWTTEETAIMKLYQDSKKEDQDIQRDCKVTIILRWRANAECCHISTAPVCYRIALDRFYDKEIAIKPIKKKKHSCLAFPVSSAAKIILKKIAFAFDMNDAEVSLACWHILYEKSAANLKAKHDAENRCDYLHEVHPEFFYHWLTKLDALGSHYSKKEHLQLGKTLYKFMNDDLGKKFRRLHAAFPVANSSHLIIYLRCINLLSESDSLLHSVRQYKEVSHQWAVNALLSTVKEHAQKWADCLTEEMITHNSLNGINNSLNTEGIHLPPLCKSLMNAITKGEIALMTTNDFLILGEKVYEAAFQSELNVSYMSVVWRHIGETAVQFLDPIRRKLLSIHPHGLLTTQIRDLLEIQPSLWILLLQLSKLYKFQNRNENQDYLNWYLPETFCECFTHLTYLWIDFALVRAMDTMSLEIDSDSFVVDSNEPNTLTCSAQEIINVIKVIQEKLSLLSFPGGSITKGKISEHIMPKLQRMIRKYRIDSTEEVLKTSSGQNTITNKMCSLIGNMKIICMETEAFIESLHITKERCKDKVDLLKQEFDELCQILFSRRIPRLNHLIAKALSEIEEEKSSLFLKNAVTSMLQPIEETLTHAKVLIFYFWRYLFEIFQNHHLKLVQTIEFKRLGYTLETLYMHFQSYYGLQTTADMEKEYHKFMEYITMKAMPSDDIIHKYFTERYEEQCTIHSLVSQQLVLNAYYVKGRKDLTVNIHMGPTIDIESLGSIKISSCRSSLSNLVVDDAKFKNRKRLSIHAKDILHSTKEEASSLRNKLKKTASGLITSVGRNQTFHVYVKASLEPSEWFKETKVKKTQKSSLNPPVFNEELRFNVSPDCKGVKRGGHLLVRIKVLTPKHSGVYSEAVLPLMQIPVVSYQAKRNLANTYLALTRPTAIEDYKSLVELDSRYEDKRAISFLQHLKESFHLT